jgi:hypothetical protein
LIATTQPQTTTQTIDGTLYTITVTIRDTDPQDANVKRIDAVVTWTSGQVGGPGRVQYSTCVFNELNPW